MPVKKMRVRAHDSPYMDQEWKRAIKENRMYAKKYAKKNTGQLIAKKEMAEHSN
jgi:hypothetical protein